MKSFFFFHSRKVLKKKIIQRDNVMNIKKVNKVLIVNVSLALKMGLIVGNIPQTYKNVKTSLGWFCTYRKGHFEGKFN